jgi:hypothetical protein
MEPGDPARLPSSGLAWAGVAAALVLAVGAFAFFNSYFGAGSEPGSLLTPAPAASPAPVASAAPATATPATGGEVILTALEDNVWLRLYEEGGDRLIERTLKRGETVLVPADATDPRLNTGRPDALAITVGGKPVAKLGETPTTISGAPVSAAALLARGTPIAAGSDVAVADNPAALPLSAPRRAAIETRRSNAAQAVAATPDPVAAPDLAPATPTAASTPPLETPATDN